MAQQNERVFFDDGEYIVSDLRFVTREGTTHPMSTIQSVYTGQDVERPGWYNNLPFNLGILALFAAGIASCGTGFALGVVGVILIPIGIALCILPIILIRRVSKRQRHRQRYWVHFLFAGEGTFTTELESRRRSYTVLADRDQELCTASSANHHEAQPRLLGMELRRGVGREALRGSERSQNRPRSAVNMAWRHNRMGAILSSHSAQKVRRCAIAGNRLNHRQPRLPQTG